MAAQFSLEALDLFVGILSREMNAPRKKGPGITRKRNLIAVCF